MWVGLDKAGLSWQYVRKWANKIEIKNSPLLPEAWFYHMAVGKKRSDVFLKFPHLFNNCNCLNPMSTAILLSPSCKDPSSSNSCPPTTQRTMPSLSSVLSPTAIPTPSAVLSKTSEPAYCLLSTPNPVIIPWTPPFTRCISSLILMT